MTIVIYMWSIASSTDTVQTVFANIGVVFVVLIPIVLTAWAATMGLGYGLRKAFYLLMGDKRSLNGF